VYHAIVQEVLGLARRPHGVVYAVPGHPLVGEATGTAVIEACRDEGLPCRVVDGLSFLEPVCTALGVDPLCGGVQLVDALSPRLDPQRPAILGQLYGQRIASQLKLALVGLYPEDHPVTVVSHAGVPGQERTLALPLEDLDRQGRFDHLTCLYVPALAPERDVRTFAGLQHIVRRLRAPDGCPWDREQTHASLKGFLLEEAYEALAALDEGDPHLLREELGDLLMQIMLQAQIADESGEFEMGDVIEGIATKLVRRHPHVFGEVELETAEEVALNWEVIKKEERGEEPLLAAVPISLPALAHAQSLQDRAARVGFEWPHLERVLDKLTEELRELSRAESLPQRLDEFGDVLFMLTSVARKLGIDAEEALRLAARKFRERFTRMEFLARERGRTLEGLSLADMERLWEEAKG
jgi:tetrapyrrole methylase family protein/MazG family protein